MEQDVLHIFVKDPQIELKDEILLGASRVQISKIFKDKIVETILEERFLIGIKYQKKKLILKI